ncbi:CusA/CzcA family heavy metal efflux RND transporter [Sphingomonas sp. CARO-RG-8B-R24-01]|uniref:efflux RND transporter permease subunit n=1 Tax=Sphingomonas sp. CARO-RG-8B-R24-01 TaxID=2914831 RepID=UPI001F56ED4C|nr:CusA/CzcA family heavy metal efflux RND transporter [Sphingomonas sp. CARO-RG-8B-R24-01]
MLRTLVAWALSARLAVIALAAILVALGVMAYRALPIDAYPDISSTQVKMILKAPGMTPEEVETRVVTPIETEMLGIPKQAILRSTAKYAIADVTIDFQDGTDIYWARQQVAERLTGVMADLPPGVTGGLAPISTPLSDVYMFTIEGPLSLTQKRTLLDWTLRPALRTVPGVADVNSLGGLAESFEIKPDANALAAAGITIADLKTAIMNNNRNDGAGRLTEGEEALIVRATGAVEAPEDVAQIVIKSGPTGITRVGDVAQVVTGSLTRYGAVTRSGRGEAVEGLVIALKGADASKVVEGVRAKLAGVTLPKGTHLNVFYDRSQLIHSAVSTVEEALLEATVIVIVLLLIFLGDWRAALIVASTLPLAALITFILMRAFGVTANLMSLGGLAIAIGLLVDGSVVVVENIVERIADPKLKPERRLHRIFVAVGEVIVPVSAGIVIIALVFLPLLSLQGLEGKLFAPVALTIVFALAGSLLVALTLVPVLGSYGLKAHSADDKEPWVMRHVRPAYTRALDAAFGHKAIVGIGAGVLLAIAVVAYLMVGKTFMPTLDEGSVVMQLTKLPSIGLDHSLADDMAAQRAVMRAVPEVTNIVSRTGSDQIGLDPMGLNETDSYVTLKPRGDWRKGDKEWLVTQMRDAMNGLPGVQPSFTQPIEMRVSEMLTGSRGDLALKIFGTDNDQLAQIAGKMKALIAATKGATDVQTLAEDHVNYLELGIDRLAAGNAGIPVSDVQDALRAQLEGLDAGVARIGQRRVPITIRGSDDIRQSPTAFEDLLVRSPTGTLAHVSDLAHVSRKDGPVLITHEDGQRYALVQASVTGRDLVGFVQEVQQKAQQQVKLPGGYHFVWGGQFENQRRASQRLMIVIPIALALILLVLFATLRSMRAALLILANIPFAMVGGIVALLITSSYLSVPASVGFIALLGIAVLNGLVMVSHIRDLRDDGRSLHDAVRDGAERRLRPVLMTATITAVGLVPVLFATGPGSEIQRPLAIVVIGGLITSTLLTLILLPILYERFGEAKE